MSFTRWRLAIAAFLVAPTMAAAADLPAAPPAPTAPATYAPPASDWTVTVGIEPRAVPAWPGAADTRFGFTFLPLFSIRKAGTPAPYFGPRDSFGFSLIDAGPLKIGPAFQLIWKRDSSSYNELNGLHDVDYALQAGGFIEFWPVPWLRLRGEVRQGFGGETGVTADGFLDAVIPIGQFRWSAGPRVTVQSANATSPYFSISAAEAVNANALQPGLGPLTAYTAGGGLYSYGAGTQLEYFFNQQWSAHVFGEYQRLTDSAANSPLVIQRGSPNQFTVGVGAVYSFDMHPLW
jgi:outer membrane protein